MVTKELTFLFIHHVEKYIYLQISVFLPVITLLIDFVLYSPIYSNDLYFGRKWGLHVYGEIFGQGEFGKYIYHKTLYLISPRPDQNYNHIILKERFHIPKLTFGQGNLINLDTVIKLNGKRSVTNFSFVGLRYIYSA